MGDAPRSISLDTCVAIASRDEDRSSYMGRLLRGGKRFLLIVLALALAIPSVVLAQSPERGNAGDELPTFKPPADEVAAVPGQLIVRYKEGVGQAERATLRRQESLEKKGELGLINAEVVEVGGRSVGEAMRDLNARANVEYAEPNFRVYPAGFADEPRFA